MALEKINTRFYLGDCIEFGKQKGYISGFTGANCYVKDENNEYIVYENSKGKTQKSIPLKVCKQIKHSTGWISYYNQTPKEVGDLRGNQINDNDLYNRLGY